MFSKFQLAIPASLHAVSAVYRFVSGRLERKLGDLGATLSAGQIDLEHLTRTTAESASAAASAVVASVIAEIANASAAINRTITRRLERQL